VTEIQVKEKRTVRTGAFLGLIMFLVLIYGILTVLEKAVHIARLVFP